MMVSKHLSLTTEDVFVSYLMYLMSLFHYMVLGFAVFVQTVVCSISRHLLVADKKTKNVFTLVVLQI